MTERRPNPDRSPAVPKADDRTSGRRPSAMNLGRVAAPRYAGPEPVRISSKKPSAMRLHEIGVRVPLPDADADAADPSADQVAHEPRRARRFGGVVVGFAFVFAVAVAAVVWMPRMPRTREPSSSEAIASSPAAALGAVSAPSAPSTAPPPSTATSSLPAPSVMPTAERTSPVAPSSAQPVVLPSAPSLAQAVVPPTAPSTAQSIAPPGATAQPASGLSHPHPASTSSAGKSGKSSEQLIF